MNNKHELEKILAKTWCDGTWKHKYNQALNEKISESTGEPNDRTAEDVGVEKETVGIPKDNNEVRSEE